MAISKNFFGLRTKSTKSHTFSVFRGMQVTKDRVSSVANPQSTAQMEQRLILPLVASAATKLNGLIDHSFEGVPYGYQSVYEFRRANMAKGALNVSQFVPKGFGDCGTADFLVSKGSLESTTCNENAGEVSVRFPAALTSNEGNETVFFEWRNSIDVDNDFDDKRGTALAKCLGLQKGDQLTFLVGGQVTPAVELTNGSLMRNKFVVSRLILGGNDAGENNFICTSKSADGKVIELTDGYLNLTIDENGGASGSTKFPICINVDYSSRLPEFSTQPAMATCIISRKDGNVWRRSTQRLDVIKGGIANSYSYEQALPSYLKPTTNSGSDKYLNNGLEGVNITGGRG